MKGIEHRGLAMQVLQLLPDMPLKAERKDKNALASPLLQNSRAPPVLFTGKPNLEWVVKRAWKSDRQSAGREWVCE